MALLLGIPLGVSVLRLCASLFLLFSSGDERARGVALECNTRRVRVRFPRLAPRGEGLGGE